MSYIPGAAKENAIKMKNNNDFIIKIRFEKSTELANNL